MGKIRVTYDVEFKKKAVDLYLKEGMSYKIIVTELGIHHSVVSRWVKHFEAEGIHGLEEKRRKVKGPGLGRPRTKPEDSEAKLNKRLEVEGEMLKKLLGMQKKACQLYPSYINNYLGVGKFGFLY